MNKKNDLILSSNPIISREFERESFQNPNSGDAKLNSINNRGIKKKKKRKVIPKLAIVFLSFKKKGNDTKLIT